MTTRVVVERLENAISALGVGDIDLAVGWINGAVRLLSEPPTRETTVVKSITEAVAPIAEEAVTSTAEDAPKVGYEPPKALRSWSVGPHNTGNAVVLSANEVRNILVRANAGVSALKLADVYGVSRATINRIVRFNGSQSAYYASYRKRNVKRDSYRSTYRRANYSGGAGRPTDAKIAEVAELYTSGIATSVAALAERTGLPTSSVKYALTRLNRSANAIR